MVMKKKEEATEPKVRRPKGKMMTSEQVAEMIKLWDSKTIDELAAYFTVQPSTINNMGATIRKMNPKFCETKGRISRKRIIEAALELVK
jgi:hypothetical protein